MKLTSVILDFVFTLLIHTLNAKMVAVTKLATATIILYWSLYCYDPVIGDSTAPEATAASLNLANQPM